MESRPEGANNGDSDVQGGVPSSITSHPWWRGPGFGPAGAPENASKAQAAQSPLHGSMNEGGDVSKEMQSIRNGSDGSFGSEHHHMQPVSSGVPPLIPEYLVPHGQLELGQAIACASYSYPDPYTGMMAAYGPQAMVHPQLLGMPHTRMPLPLEMAEEPVYVNAKQYHGILRRRQSRAKAELEKKVIKSRKPYLHESRHQHAMRRARGCGGRFLNTKKTEDNVTYSNPEGDNSGASNQTQSAGSSGSEARPSDYYSANVGPTSSAAMSMQGMYRPHQYASDNNHSNHEVYQHQQQHAGFQLSAFHSNSGERMEEGDCSGQQRGGRLLVNRPPNRAVAIQ